MVASDTFDGAMTNLTQNPFDGATTNLTRENNDDMQPSQYPTNLPSFRYPFNGFADDHQKYNTSAPIRKPSPPSERVPSMPFINLTVAVEYSAPSSHVRIDTGRSEVIVKI